MMKRKGSSGNLFGLGGDEQEQRQEDLEVVQQPREAAQGQEGQEGEALEEEEAPLVALAPPLVLRPRAPDAGALQSEPRAAMMRPGVLA